MEEGAPRVVYSIATGLGGTGLAQEAFEAVLGTWRQGWLEKIIVYGNRQQAIPRRFVRNIRLHPGKPLSFVPARFYYGMKMEYLDWVAARRVRRGCDLFHGWVNECWRALRAVRERGAVGFVEMPGPHAFNRRMVAFWEEECARYGFGDMHNDTTYAGGLLAYFVTRRRKMLEEFALAHRIVVPSEFVRDTFREEGVPDEKLVLIPRGVDAERFRPAAEPPATFRAVFVGAIGHRKGVHYLLEAWERLGLPDGELLLAGGVQAEIAPLVARHAGKLGVRCVGHVDPLPFYQSASVFVFPSLSEGSAKVTYEAMACGLPVVVTPNAGSVARDGVDGLVVPVRDASALAEGILKLYRDPDLRLTMGRAARKRAEAHTWEHYRARILAAYADALGLPRPDVPLAGPETARVAGGKP